MSASRSIVAALALIAGGCVEPATGGAADPRRLTDHPAEDRAPSWSPQGDRLLFTSDRDGDFEVYSIRADGDGLERLTVNPGADLDPAWSPDGDRFVFQSVRAGVAGLWIARFGTSGDRGEPELLLEDASAELVPDWSPDGRWVAFGSERDGNPELYRVEIGTGRVERLTVEPYRDHWPRYFPDGKSLVFFSRRGTAGEHDDLYRLELATLEVTRLTDHPGHHDFVPDPSPDGERVVAGMSDRVAGRRELVVHTSDGKAVTRFAGGLHRVFHPAWSPDGKTIVFAARVADGDRADLYLVPAP